MPHWRSSDHLFRGGFNRTLQFGRFSFPIPNWQRHPVSPLLLKAALLSHHLLNTYTVPSPQPYRDLNIAFPLDLMHVWHAFQVWCDANIGERVSRIWASSNAHSSPLWVYPSVYRVRYSFRMTRRFLTLLRSYCLCITQSRSSNIHPKASALRLLRPRVSEQGPVHGVLIHQNKLLSLKIPPAVRGILPSASNIPTWNKPQSLPQQNRGSL